jgi:beta-glucosidase
MKKTRRFGRWMLVLAVHSTIFGAPQVRTEASAITPRDATWHARWHEKIAAAMAAGKGDFGLVLIGDSITDLWPTKGPTSYAKLLPWKPLNLGISGENTEHVLHRIANGQLEGIKSKAAMILIGTNNLGHSDVEKPEWTAAGVKKIVATVRAKLPETKILLLAIFPRGGAKGPDGIRPNSKSTDAIRQRVAQTNKLLAPIADNKTVFFLDFGHVFTNADGTLRMDLMPDALHPNEAGYRVWLDAIWPKLEELMK